MAGIFSITIKNSYIWIMASRMVQGVGAGGTYQLAMALAADVFPADQRTKVLGILEAGNGLGKVISPLAGAAVMLIVWYAPFFVYGALAIPVGILVWTLVIQAPPKEGNRKISKYLDTLRSIWSNRGAALLGCFAAGFIVLFMLFGLLADFSDVLEDKFMLKSFSKGLVIAVPVFIMTLTAYITGLLLQRKSSLLLKNVVGIGLGLEAGSILLLSFLNGLWLIVGAFSMAGAGSGLVLPSLNTLITSSAEKDERGLITALYGSMRFFGAAFGPPAFGLAVVLGKRWMFWGAAAITLLTSVVMLYFVDARRLAFDKAGSSKVEKANADTNTNGECDCHKIDDIW
jgi:ACDE family multidrug resistance protein